MHEPATTAHRRHPGAVSRRRSLRFRMGCVLLASLLGVALPAETPLTVHDFASRVDSHYNRLSSFRANFRERFDGLGMHRDEAGTLLLKKPGRMRWRYSNGKLFVLDGRSAISYAPGDQQAQRIPAKQLDDLRSPLRFLLGHTRLEKELDRLTLTTQGNTATLTGSPHSTAGSETSRIQSIALTVNAASGSITGLAIDEIDGSRTVFTFSEVEENSPATDADFRFTPPEGVTVVDGTPPV